jgi:hypothetical protein
MTSVCWYSGGEAYLPEGGDNSLEAQGGGAYNLFIRELRKISTC